LKQSSITNDKPNIGTVLFIRVEIITLNLPNNNNKIETIKKTDICLTKNKT